PPPSPLFPYTTLFRSACQRRGQQRAAGQVDAVFRVHRGPAFPHRARRVAEHRAAIELLRIAQDRPEFHGGSLLPATIAPGHGFDSTSPLPTGLRGSLAARSTFALRSHSTVFMLPQLSLERRPSLASPGTSTSWPIARRRATTSAGSASRSMPMTSGSHWWW